MRSRSQTRIPASKLFLHYFIIVLLASLVAANTEIRNFRVGAGDSEGASSPSLSVGSAWIRAGFGVLNERRNERSFRVSGAPAGTALGDVCEEGGAVAEDWAGKGGGGSCPHELWLVLELGADSDADGEEGWWGWGWKRFDMFTIRLSWPAFYPADFDITLYSPEELDAYMQTTATATRHPPRIAESRSLNSSDESESESGSESERHTHVHSRVRYARIRLVNTGVRPSLPLSNPSSSSSSSSSTPSSSNKNDMQADEGQKVPFTIILEPLLLDILPASLIPTILLSVPVLVGVAFAHPYVMRYLAGVAAEASRELYERKSKVQ